MLNIYGHNCINRKRFKPVAGKRPKKSCIKIDNCCFVGGENGTFVAASGVFLLVVVTTGCPSTHLLIVVMRGSFIPCDCVDYITAWLSDCPSAWRTPHWWVVLFIILSVEVGGKIQLLNDSLLWKKPMQTKKKWVYNCSRIIVSL